MKKICEFCKKEYSWKEGQLNWKSPTSNKFVRSDKFCCYECGIKYWQSKIKEANLKKYGVENAFQSTITKEKIKNNKLKKYGDENYNNSQKMKQTKLIKYGSSSYVNSEKQKETKLKKLNENLNYYKNSQEKREQTCLEKYGSKNVFQVEEKKQKIKNTNLKKYGVSNFSKSKLYKNLYKNKDWISKKLEKQFKSLKSNNHLKYSRPEEEIYKLLVEKYSSVERQYKSKKYPFLCDFYIPKEDLYIEYQGHWSHNNFPFDKNNKKHLIILNKWKSKGTKFYNNAIETWTIRDVNKRKIAKENNLNWIEFFNMEEFYEWYNKGDS